MELVWLTKSIHTKRSPEDNVGGGFYKMRELILGRTFWLNKKTSVETVLGVRIGMV